LKISVSVRALLAGCATAAIVCQYTAAAADADLRLLEALKHQDSVRVNALLQQPFDVNAAEADGATALHWAAHWDALDTAARLLQAGADPNRANSFGITPLWLACENGSARMVQRLLAAGANANIGRPDGQTPLMMAARTGNRDVVTALLEHGADPRAKERAQNQTALMWAVAEKHSEITQLLIAHGASVSDAARGGFTPLMFAAREGDLQSARLLLDAGARVDEIAAGACASCTALIVATVRGHVDLAVFLLDRGANANADGPGYTALHWASGSWDTDNTGVYGYLNGSDDPEWSHLAGLRGPEKLVLIGALLKHGANPNVRLRRDAPRIGGITYMGRTLVTFSVLGATPFFLASLAGDVAAMRALAAGGADPRLMTNDKTTPLMAAAGIGHVLSESRVTESAALEASKYALEQGNDVNAANDHGETALHGAADSRLSSIIEWLVGSGAAMNVADKRERTPLQIAELDFQKGGGDPTPARSGAGDVLRRLGASK
jgi:ankyrin repeat protein